MGIAGSRWAGPSHALGGTFWCSVRPDQLGEIEVTLDRFFATLMAPGVDEWRPAFETAVREAVTIVLEHTRPQLVQLRLFTDPHMVVVLVRESGHWWLGHPGPADVMAHLTGQSRAAFDELTHHVDHLGHNWTMSKHILSPGLEPGQELEWPAPDARGPVRAGAIGAGSGPVDRFERSRSYLAELVAYGRCIVASPRTGEVPHPPTALEMTELAELADVLRSLHEMAMDHEVTEALIKEAPIGIATLGSDARYWRANQTFADMYHYRTPEDLIGRLSTDDSDPEIMERNKAAYLDWWEGRYGPLEVANRRIWPDGTVNWHTTILCPLRGATGQPEGMVLFVQDTTERTLQKERAARIQARLLPSASPELDDYELAGGCMPADDMSGDFYDWVRHRRHLDLTIADVMGKGMGAALVMAALRTGLRAVRRSAGPLDRTRIAVQSLGLGNEDDGLFVTLFQARLDLETGVLRYVDAGHGHWAVRRADGRLDHRRSGSMPLLVMPVEDLQEHELHLDPGDMLVLHSDGLVEVEGETLQLSDYRADLDEAGDAETIVRRLLGRAPGILTDDVTVVVLRRREHPCDVQEGDEETT